MLDGSVAAGEREVAQVKRPFKIQIVCDQDLTAPNGHIGPQAGPVKGDADDASAASQADAPPCRQRCGHGGAELPKARMPSVRSALQRVARGEIVRMEVVGHGHWRGAKQLLEVRDAGLEGSQRLVVLEVTDVMAHESISRGW